MKKLLSFLGVITLAGGGASSVISCKSSSAPKSDAQKIADEIKNKNIAIPAKSNPDTANQATIQALQKSIELANPNFKKDNLQYLTFESIKLKDNEQTNPLKAFIKVGAKTATLTLEVVIHSTAQQIASKITKPTYTTIGIPAGTNPSLSNAATQIAIRLALQKAYKLSIYDMNAVSFVNASSVTLTDNEASNIVELKITDDATPATTANVTLKKVQIHSSSAQIKTKIEATGRLQASFVNTDTTATTLTQTNANKILVAFKDYNKYLSPWDQTCLSVPADPAKTLTLNDKTLVSLKITDDNTKTVPVTMQINAVRLTSASGDQYDVNQIADKIATARLVAIRAGSSVSVKNSDTVTALRASLVSANNDSNLTSAQADKITFTTIDNNNNLVNNEVANDVTATITEGSASTSVVLKNVQIHSTAAQIETKLEDVGRLGASFINVDASDTKLDTTNISKILEVIKTNNTELSKWDKEQLGITIASGTTLVLDTRQNVTMKITDDASPAPGAENETISVARFEATSYKYKAFHIADKIGTDLTVPTPADTSKTFASAVPAIKTGLLKVNPLLNKDDIAKMTFAMKAGSTWTGGESSNRVNVTIQVGSTTTIVELRSVVIHRTADELKNFIDGFTTPVTIAGPAGDTGTGTIDAQIKAEMIVRIYGFSQWDATQITIPPNIALSTTARSIKIKVTDDASPPDQEAATINVKTSS